MLIPSRAFRWTPLLAAALLLLAPFALASGQEAPKTAARSDQELATAIRARFAQSKIAESKFTVTVRDGIATIEGVAAKPQHKGVATRLARLEGARSVRNLVRTNPQPKAAPSKPKAASPAAAAATPSELESDSGESRGGSKPLRKVTVTWPDGRR